MNRRLGILGGGQLARMLAEGAISSQIDVLIYADENEKPVRCLKQLKSKIITGKLTDLAQLKKFTDQCTDIVFESEFISDQVIEYLSENVKNIRFTPQLSVIQRLKNKGEQKKLYKKLGCLQPDFYIYTGDKNESDVLNWLYTMNKNLGESYVIKWAEGGYDGKGVFFLNAQHNIQAAVQFCMQAFSSHTSIYAEEKIDIDKECAAVCVRDKNGEYFFYPLVLSVQESGVCREVLGPAIEYGIHTDIEKKSIDIMKKITHELDYQGAFALEFFISKSGELYINECAPRVHNSGHFTQIVYEGSQFENHVRAAVGLPYLTSHKPGFFYMRNLLSPVSKAGTVDESKLKNIEVEPQWSFYWYGKTQFKKMRKLGHVNYWSQKKEDILENQNRIKQWEKTLWEKLL